MNFGSSYVYSYDSGSGGSSESEVDLGRGLAESGGESGGEYRRVRCDSGDELWKPAGAAPVLVASRDKSQISQAESSDDEDFPKAVVKSKPPKHGTSSEETEAASALRPFLTSLLSGDKKEGSPKKDDEADGPILDQKKVLQVKEPETKYSSGKAQRATKYVWPRSRMLDQIDGVIPMSEMAKVMVLYCKDTGMKLLREPYQKMPQQFGEAVNLLADILSSCGGIFCYFDGYDSVCVDNWSLWVQKSIEQSDFVLTVCSPMLYQVLRDANHKLVEMLRGKFYPDAVVNYISPHKFIPVFLDMPARDEWVPVNLQTSTYYELHVSDFATAMGDTEGMHPLVFEKKMSTLLEDPRFEKIALLIATLRKESVNPRPIPPPRLIHPIFFGRPFCDTARAQEDDNPNENLGEDVEKDKGKTQARQVRRADTNIIAVDFSVLKKPGEIHTGDSVVCSNANCGAALSHLSRLEEDLDQNETVWRCEFCGTENIIDTATEEVPKKETILYLLTPPPPSTTGSRDDQSLVIFCIDVSGSMGVTTEVPGKFVLRNHDHVHAADIQALNETGESQHLRSEGTDITYVSRLQGVQAAVESQITKLAIENPAQKIAIVTFSDEVNIYCDGSSNVTTIAGDRLWNSEALDRSARDVRLPPCIAHVQDALCEKVLSLKEGGQTALGPALLVSILIASRATESRVVICTDGMANTGIGNLEDISTRDAYSAAQTFYSDLGILAEERGVKVSVVTIKGTDCRVIELGQVADKTRGEVLTVDPLTVCKEFSNILANSTIATNVDVKIILHSKLYVRTYDPEKRESMMKVHVGNAASDTELTFEYGVRKHNEAQAKHPQEASLCPQVADEDPSEIVKSKHQSGSLDVSLLYINGRLYYPFQVQFAYTKRDGARLLKIITQVKPKTTDRETAEKGVDVNVVGTHAAHTVAALAIDGEYSQARINAFAVKKLLKRSTAEDEQKREDYTSAMERIIPFEHLLRDRQEAERKRTRHGGTYSGRATRRSSGDESSHTKRELRHREAGDEMAALAYQLKNTVMGYDSD